MVRMRIAYRDQLDAFARDLVVMCDIVNEIITKASSALIRGSLEEAEDALSMADGLDEIRRRCEQRAIDLLLLESPVASDLRQVISSIYIVNDLRRMGALGMHIANTARRRHPDIAVADPVKEQFQEIAAAVLTMMGKTREVLITPDEKVAYDLAAEDDAVDEMNQAILTEVTGEEWAHTNREAVDAAMLTRYYERFADHCVSVAARVVYLVTGMPPEERSDAFDHPGTDAEILHRFTRLKDPR
ncbi:hypothetical protein CGUA_11180 [Corynebacterium guangdongense]|nr:hypothetical protein CGUA_11180 [Corynebacterium guangdongense]